jgi:hypothetical protein
MARQHPPEIVECTDCGSEFNLAAQAYYDNRCPSCKREESGEDAVDPVYGQCYVCDEDVRKSEQHYSNKAAPYDVHGKVLVCPDHRDHKWTPSRGI